MRTVFLRPASNVFSQMFRSETDSPSSLTPGLQNYFGPFPLMNYALHLNAGPKLASLSELEAQRKTIDQVEKSANKWDLPLSDNSYSLKLRKQIEPPELVHRF